MSFKSIRFIFMTIAVLQICAGCNDVVFIDEKLEPAVTSYSIDDIGGSVEVILAKDHWMIEHVYVEVEESVRYNGVVAEEGKLGTSSIMYLKGNGEIICNDGYGGFHLKRNTGDRINVVLSCNLSRKPKRIVIGFCNEFESCEVEIVQEASEGFLISDVEVDETPLDSRRDRDITRYVVFSNTSESMWNFDLHVFANATRTIWLDRSFYDSDGNITPLSKVLYLLDEDNIGVPVPEPYVKEGKISITDERLSLGTGMASLPAGLPDEVVTYTVGPGNWSFGTRLMYETYLAGFVLTLRHRTCENIMLTYRGTIYSKTPCADGYTVELSEIAGQ